MTITLKGRSISKGYAEGEALVRRQPIGFNFGVNFETGVITEYNHELCGKSIKDKIFDLSPRKGKHGGILCGLPVGEEARPGPGP